MNWASCGVSNTGDSERFTSKLSSRGVSIRDMRCSMYSRCPSNISEARAGRTQRVDGGGCRIPQGMGHRKPSSRSSSLVNPERQATTTSGEMSLDSGIPSMQSLTRSVADKRRFRSTGNGNAMFLNWSDRRSGADPLKIKHCKVQRP